MDADRPARVVINERTGTIVMGGGSPHLARGHHAWQSQHRNSDDVCGVAAQPAGYRHDTSGAVSRGGREKRNRATWYYRARPSKSWCALASIGSTPRDIIAILQNLRAAGALEAELEVI